MSKTFDYIKQLLITKPVLYMLMENDKFRLESDTNKMAAGGILFQY